MSSEARHTPGPWRDEDGEVYAEGQDHPVASVAQIFGYPDEEEAANARLIAAAPELLEAAQSAFEAIEKGWLTNAADVGIVLGRLRRAVDKAEAV